MAREPISKKLRFEIIRRDNSTCRYCGRASPSVVLEIDHLIPVKLGGTNDLLNLVCSCEECNRGKGARPLDDLTLERAQCAAIDSLNVSLQTQAEILKRYDAAKATGRANIGRLLDMWWNLTGQELGEDWIPVVQRWAQAFGFGIVADAMHTARTKDIHYVGAVAAVNYEDDHEPGIKRCYLLRGLLSKKFPQVDRRETLEWLKEAKREGIDLDLIEAAINNARFLYEFVEQVDRPGYLAAEVNVA